MALYLRLFGAPRLERDSAAVTGRAVQRRRLAMLILLSRAARRTLTRERILGYLWPETAPDSARRLLTESIYVVRRELGESVVVTSADDVTLSAAVLCDADEIIRAAELGDWDSALALHVSPFLDGWYVSEAPEFDQWLESERQQFNVIHRKSASKLALSRESTGDWHGAVETWNTLLRSDPYNSTAVVHSARALVAVGDRAGAVTLIQAHETRLREDLGADLDKELVELARDIRAGRLQPATRTSATVPVAPSAIAVELPQSASGAENFSSVAATELAASASDETRAALQSRASPSDKRVETPQQEVASKLGRERRFVSRRALLAALGTAAGAAMLLGVVTSQRALRAAPIADSTPQLDPLRIAVLYFDAASADGANQYVADGLAEGLIRELSAVGSLRVLSRDAVAHYQHSAISTDSIGRLLSAGTVVHGTVTESDGRIRVLARIIDAATARQIATITVDQARTELFALTDSLSQRTADALRTRLGADVRVRTISKRVSGKKRSDRALDLLLQAERLRKTADAARSSTQPEVAILMRAKNNLQTADSLLAVAQSLDAAFPELAIERAWVAVLSGQLEFGTARVVALAPAIGHAERARADMRQSGGDTTKVVAAIQHVLGTARFETAVAVQTHRSESALLRLAIANLDSAVERDSGIAVAWATLSEARRVQGEFQLALLAAQRALDADTFLASADVVLFTAFISAIEIGDAANARRWCARGRERFPRNWKFTECELTTLRLDAVGLSTRRPDMKAAWALVDKLETMDPEPKARASGRPYSPTYRRLTAAAVSAAAGDKETGRRILLNEFARVRGNPELSTDILYDAAFVYIALDEPATAKRLLHQYVAARPDLRQYVERDATLRAVQRIQ